MKVAYVRVSTEEQNEARQIEALKKHGIEKWFTEKISGKSMDRPQLQAMLDYVREGDTVYIHDFSRLARSTRDLLEIVERLQAKSVHLVSNKENLDTGTPTGKLMLTMIAAINEFERQNLLDRQREGIAIAKRNGIYKGRKKVTTPDDFSELYARYTRREMNKGQLAEALHVTRPTLERIIREHLAAATQIWKSDKLFCHELVSHASDCAQIKRLVGVILNFRAQAADMYHNGVVVYHIVAPDAAVDLLFGQHLVLVGEEILHQEALLAGKRAFDAFFQ